MVRPALSVVIPVLNEEAGLGALFARLVPVLENLGLSFDILVVDDGSTDGTLTQLMLHNSLDARIKAVSFSRNFGKEIAICAGLRFATGDAVLVMDADLQHPPEAIPAFVAALNDGADVVYGVRDDRQHDSWLRRALTRRFYKLFARVGETPLPEGAGDFRLFSRKAVNALNALPERARFSKGLYAWVGFRQVPVPFKVGARFAGNSRFPLRRLVAFAIDGLTSFSTAPLRLAVYIGTLISMAALGAAGYFLVRTLVQGTDVPGFPSLMVSIMFFSGLQLVFLGVLGEYIGRIFDEVKRRPLYIVREAVGLVPEARWISGAVDTRRTEEHL